MRTAVQTPGIVRQGVASEIAVFDLGDVGWPKATTYGDSTSDLPVVHLG